MLKLTDVTFLYAPHSGISNASFTIAQGECVGITGGNGAGKSTLLGLLAAALLPQKGSISLVVDPVVGGRRRTFNSSAGISYRRQVGYMPEGAPLYQDMTVKAYLRYRAQLKGERYLRLRRRVREAITRCELGAYEQTLIANLSYGLQRRVALAEALLLLPVLLILDDPFSGLDQEMRVAMIEILKNFDTRTHIIMSGHDTTLMSQCCHRILTVRQGQLIEEEQT